MRYELASGILKVTADVPHARHQDALPIGHRARFAVPAEEILVLAAG